MQDFLPLFPLKLVVFPGEKLNLHVFEPRYKQLVRECEQNNTTFGIPVYINNDIADFGTEVKLLSIEKRYENGELDIKTQGVGVFKIDSFYRTTPNKLYSGADIDRIPNDLRADSELNESIREKVIVLFDILRINPDLDIEQDDFHTYDIAHHVGFSFEQEYEFLGIPTELERQSFLLDHLENVLPVVREMERLRKRAQLNGHFKNVISPK